MLFRLGERGAIIGNEGKGISLLGSLRVCLESLSVGLNFFVNVETCM